MDLYYAGLDVLRTALLFVGSVVIFIGVVWAVLGALRAGFGPHVPRRIVGHMALGLEFQLASDILATAVAPTFEEVQLLAAIVVIRTVLNYFLQKELEREQDLPKPERDASEG